MPAALMMLATIQKKSSRRKVLLPKAPPSTVSMGCESVIPSTTSPMSEGQTMSMNIQPYSTPKKTPITARPAPVRPSGGVTKRNTTMIKAMTARFT